MSSACIDGINREVSKEIEWEVDLPLVRRWRLESPVFLLEGVKYRLWLYTDYLHPEWIRLQFDMLGPFVTGPLRVVLWKIGVKRGNGADPLWSEGRELIVQDTFSDWKVVDKWKIFEKSKLERDREALAPDGRLTFVLQLRQGQALILVKDSSTQIEAPDHDGYEKAGQRVNRGTMTSNTDISSGSSKSHSAKRKRTLHKTLSDSEGDLTLPEKMPSSPLNPLSRVIDLVEHQEDGVNNRTLPTNPLAEDNDNTPLRDGYEKADQRVNCGIMTSNTDISSGSSKSHSSKRKRSLHKTKTLSDSEGDLTLPEKMPSSPLNPLSRVIDLTEYQEDVNNRIRPTNPLAEDNDNTPLSDGYEKAGQRVNRGTMTSNTDISSGSSKSHSAKRKITLHKTLSDSEGDLTLPEKMPSSPLNPLSRVIDLVEHQEDGVNNRTRPTNPLAEDNDNTPLRVSIEFQKTVMQKLNDILHKVQAIEDRLRIVENKQKREINTTFSRTVPEKDYFEQIPLATDSALLEIEQELHQKGIDDLVISLKVIGGANEQECITRILQRLVTNEIAENYSWSGSKGKEIFKDLYVAKAVFGAAKSHYPALTQKYAETVIANWLRYAKQRRQREEEKAMNRKKKRSN